MLKKIILKCMLLIILISAVSCQSWFERKNVNLYMREQTEPGYSLLFLKLRIKLTGLLGYRVLIPHTIVFKETGSKEEFSVTGDINGHIVIPNIGKGNYQFVKVEGTEQSGNVTTYHTINMNMSDFVIKIQKPGIYYLGDFSLVPSDENASIFEESDEYVLTFEEDGIEESVAKITDAIKGTNWEKMKFYLYTGK